MRVERTIDLPFAPREQWLSPDGGVLVVADAFGGNLAVIDLPAGRVRAVRSLPGHNIRGIAASAEGRELLFSHLVLDEALETTSSRISWGGIVAGMVRSVALRHLLETPSDVSGAQRASERDATPVTRWSVFPTGEQGRGGGDPGDVLVTEDGTVVVALSGVNEVAVRGRQGVGLRRVPVGRRPAALTASRDGRHVYVANTFDDSVSVIDPAKAEVVATIALGAPAKPTDAQFGEMLFHDARLSLDGWYSCHSCHTDGHTSGRRNDNFTDGSFGSPKQIPSLLGAGDTRPWAWDGSVLELEEQGGKSILGTMHGQAKGATAENVRALAAYLRTLKPPPSVEVARGTLDAGAVRRGKAVFEQLDCARCHAPPAYTAPRTYDVGLPDEWGKARFNPPSLRGVGQRDSLLHDGRAKSLRDVFSRFKHPDAQELPARQVEDLLSFLRSL
jgi:YVTN family beta-propeller protein